MMNENTFQFLQPAWLALGVVLVAMGFWLFRMADKRRSADLAKLAHPRFQQRLIAGWSPALRWTRRGLWLAAILFLSIAAARPQLGYEWREVKRRGIDILFAVDTSRSMLAQDLVPNRLERARLGIIDFLGRLEGDRVGLVPFAGSAFALCPLTLDYDAFRESLNSINTDLIPRQGTDLASAIHEADRLFDAEGNNQRFLVLITDGEDLQGEAVTAAEASAKNGTTIYTVGVGAVDGQLIPIRDQYGRESYLKDASGQNVKTKLDEKTLKKIAEITGGLYVPLGRGAEGLDAIYQKRLALAPKSELAQKLEKIPLERFQWPLGVALFMLALQAVLGERKPERKKKTLVSAARRVRPVVVLAATFFLAAQGLKADEVKAYNGGTTAYEAGEFEQAAEKLTESLATADLELQQKSYYNLGNSLYRIGQGTAEEDPKKTMATWEKAIKAYDDSLALEPSDPDTEFNRDFVKRKLEELKQQEEKKEQQKQDEQKQDEQKQDQKDQQQGDSKDGQPEDGESEEKPKPDEPGKDQKPTPGDKGAEEQEKDDKPGDQKQDEGEKSPDAKPEDQKPGEGNQDKEQEEPKPGEEKSAEEPQGMKGQEEKKPEDKEQSGQAAGEPAGESGKSGSAAQSAGERKEGEMSREEAMRLLDTLGADERVVIPVPAEKRQGKDNNSTKGKTW